MSKKENPKERANNALDVAKVIEDFQKSEESSGHRNGTFKINAPFEKALDTILKAKPVVKKPTIKR